MPWATCRPRWCERPPARPPVSLKRVRAQEELGEGEGVAGSEEVATARACTEDVAPLFT